MADEERGATDDRLALIRAIVAVAWADGSISDTERERVRQITDFLRLDEAQRRAVDAMLAPDAPPPEWPDPAELRAYEVRLYVFQQALTMSFADGHVHEDERGLLDDLAAGLELDGPDVSTAWRRAREMAPRTD